MPGRCRGSRYLDSKTKLQAFAQLTEGYKYAIIIYSPINLFELFLLQFLSISLTLYTKPSFYN
jgi:hypothetical protein